MSRYRQELGAQGEELAAEWYRAAGYAVVDRNWRCPQGEIDLVARRGSILVICEVKTRRTAAFGSPAEAVTSQKQARLRRLAGHWLRAHRSVVAGAGVRNVRFDLAAVVGGRVSVLEDAW